MGCKWNDGFYFDVEQDVIIQKEEGGFSHEDPPSFRLEELRLSLEIPPPPPAASGTSRANREVPVAAGCFGGPNILVLEF